MKNLKPVSAANLILLVVLAAAFIVSPATGQSPAPPAAAKLDKKEVLTKARASYYVLQDLGLKTVECNVQPEWKKMLDSVEKKSVDAADSRLVALLPVSFSAAVNEQGAITLTPVVSTGGDPNPAVNQILDGSQKMLLGFFQTWTSMVFSNPFPVADDDNLSFSDQPDGYHLTEKSGEQNVEMTLGRDYALNALKVTAPGVIIITHPRFIKTDKGFLMTGAASDINNGAQKVDIQVQSQLVEGFQVPQKVTYVAIFQDTNVTVEMNFMKFQIAKK